MSMKLFALLALILAQALAQQPPIPTLPQTFQTDYTLSLDFLNGGAPFFGGRFALDYVGLGGFWSFEDYTSSYVPFLLQTAVIGVPYKGQSLLQGYSFLEIGRCWKIDKLSEDDFHQWAMAIPPGATFTGNTTVGGFEVGIWTYAPYQLFSATMFVRYGDNAPIRFVLSNSLFFSFTATLNNYRFQATVDPGLFSTPSGPCPEHSFTSSFRELFSFATLKKVVSNLFLSQDLFTNVFGHGLGLKRNRIDHPIKQQEQPRRAPTPPVLNQYFSSEYTVGWGTLVADNKWAQPNNIFKGFMVVDKTSGGLYYNIRDNQDANVPWTFSTSFITHPAPDNVTAYQYLTPGRCWTVGEAANPDIPLKIPDDATWVMDTSVYGIAVEIWQFPYESEYGQITVQLAVDIKNATLVFMNGNADIEFGNPTSYVVFNNWNSTRPDPSFYAPPVGPCPNMFPQQEEDH